MISLPLCLLNLLFLGVFMIGVSAGWIFGCWANSVYNTKSTKSKRSK